MKHLFRIIVAALGLLASGPLAEAQTTNVNWGLVSGSEPRALCVYDTQHVCVTVGNLNSTANTLALSTSVIPSLSSLTFVGASTGTVTIVPQSAAGTPTLTLPNASGTFAVSASAPLALSATTGNLSVTGVAGQVLAGSTPAFTATPTLGVNASTTGQLLLANGGASGASVTVQNNGATGAYNFNLPATVGTAGQCLVSQAGGASAMTWGACGATAGIKNVQVITASGTYTPTVGAQAAVVYICGGGGGGGGNTNVSAIAGGGGGGACAVVYVASVTSVSVTIGAAGAGGNTTGGDGTDGGQSAFGAVTANGGHAGIGTTNGGGGGAAQATTSGATYTIPGAPGFPNSPGYGGSSAFGVGGVIGLAATGRGAGGGGGLSASTRAGAAGTAGILIVYEY